MQSQDSMVKRLTVNNSTTSWLPALPAHFPTSDFIGGYSHSIPSGFFTRTRDKMKAATNHDATEPKVLSASGPQEG